MLRDWAIWATGWLEWNMVSPTLWPPLAWYWLVPSLTKATGWWFSLVSVPPRNTAIPMIVYGTPPLTSIHKSLHLPKSLMEYWWSLLFWLQGHLLVAHSHHTPLYPAYNCIQPYHHNFTICFNMHPHICLNYLVQLAYWVEKILEGFWRLSISAHGLQPEIISLNKTLPWNLWHLLVITKCFSHLVVANRHNHYPKFPLWATDDATNEWSCGRKGHSIDHLIYYWEPLYT